MKRLVSLLLLLALGSQTAFADCDFSRDVKAQQDGSYVYSKDCHVQVGKSLKDLKDREEQVEKLNKTIELKDLALKISDDRNMALRDTLIKMDDRISTAERMNDTQKVLFFIGGVALTGLAVWGAGQLR